MELQMEPVVRSRSGALGTEEAKRDSDPLLRQHHVTAGSSSWSSEIQAADDDYRDAATDVEAGDVSCCRICFACDGEDDGDMISPCMCKGSQLYVHRACLDHWRSVKEGFAFSHCTTCKAQFHLRVATPKDKSWRNIKYRLFMARDVFLVFLAIQTMIAVIAAFTYFVDGKGLFRKFFIYSPVRIFPKQPIPFYYCIGVVAFFLLLGGVRMALICLSVNDPRVAGCQNCIFGLGFFDCIPASMGMGGWFAILIVLIVVLAVLGITYGFFLGTMIFQRIWQRHYDILIKKELTKEYIVEDLRGHYTPPPKLDPEHEEYLKQLKLL